MVPNRLALTNSVPLGRACHLHRAAWKSCDIYAPSEIPLRLLLSLDCLLQSISLYAQSSAIGGYARLLYTTSPYTKNKLPCLFYIAHGSLRIPVLSHCAISFCNPHKGLMPVLHDRRCLARRRDYTGLLPVTCIYYLFLSCLHTIPALKNAPVDNYCSAHTCNRKNKKGSNYAHLTNKLDLFQK